MCADGNPAILDAMTPRPRWRLIALVTTLATITMSCGQVSSAAQPTTTALPGEVIDIGPSAGQVLGVVGVPFDDVLNIRAEPGADQRIVARLHPLADDVVATGAARQLTDTIWYGATVAGVTGWVNSRFVAWLADTGDATAQIVETLGRRPSAATMQDLGRIVAEATASDEPPSRITVAIAATTGDMGEVTYDVVGLADDAIYGERLHVFGRPLDRGPGFSLASVERTFLCSRGRTAEGLCS